jgi:cobalt-zinc-cadmium efflux system membrane fusion protein
LDQQSAEGALKAGGRHRQLFGKTDQEIDRIIAERKADSTLVVLSPISGYVTARAAARGLYARPGNIPVTSPHGRFSANFIIDCRM